MNNLSFHKNNSFCISILSQKKRRKLLKKQYHKLGVRPTYHLVKKNPIPFRGCLESHLSLIKKAKENNLDYVLLLEDDIIVKDSILNLPKLPENWDMLYLGGNVEYVIYPPIKTVLDEKMTFIIANYNNSDYIKVCIDSVKNQTNPNWECLIIDDCSTDNSIDIINECIKDNSKFTFLKNDKNIGYTGTLIRLVKEATTDIVAILDSDDAIHPHCCDLFLLEYSKGNRGFVYCNFWYCDQKLNKVKKGYGAPLKRGMSCIDYDNVVAMRTFRKSVYNVTEGFNESLLYAEDKDLYLKMEEVTKLYFIPYELYYYRYTEKGQGCGGDVYKMNMGIQNYKLAKQLARQRRNQKKWIRVGGCWTTHAYILKNTLYDFIIEHLGKYDREIDRFYLEKINPNYNCYMINPKILVQRDGYSDIENKQVSYEKMNNQFVMSMNKPIELTMDEAECKLVDGYKVLKLPITEDDSELPCVSIITPTFERRDIFKIALYNFYHIDYPSYKIQWVIADESRTEENYLNEMIPKDPRITYVKVKSKDGTRLPVGKKRNYLVKQAKYDIIIHMDDDDYYPPESVLARVKTLLKYPKKNIVGCHTFATYDLYKGNSCFSGDKDEFDNKIYFAEASMCYRKSFWKERSFNDISSSAEFYYFLQGRLNDMIHIPSLFVIIAITHHSNLTKDLRRVSKSTNIDFYKDLFPSDFKHILDWIKNEKKIT